MISWSFRTRRQTIVRGVVAALMTVTCAGLIGAAALVPAPPVVLPLLIVVCVGCPMLVAGELSGSIAALRRGSRASHEASALTLPLDQRALSQLCGQLDRLPETDHPLGL